MAAPPTLREHIPQPRMRVKLVRNRFIGSAIHHAVKNAYAIGYPVARRASVGNGAA